MYEVIERDALACWLVAGAKGSPLLLLDSSTIRGEVVADLIDRLDRRGLEVNLFWNPTDIGVPTFTCYRRRPASPGPAPTGATGATSTPRSRWCGR